MDALGSPRWDGTPGRTEVLYATLTDRATGTGVWVHHETVAPVGGAPPYAHGWTAVFPPDGPPRLERFGPVPAHADGSRWPAIDGAAVGPGSLSGATATLAWDLSWSDGSAPLYPFPQLAWERELLPAAQIVPWPTAVFRGTCRIDGGTIDVVGDGAVARIYGHGSARRWGWLHADLGDGAVLEIVAATAKRPGLRSLPPLALLQLRRPGMRDLPRFPLLSALRLRTRLRADGFSVRGRAGGAAIDVDVTLPADHRVALQYTDPDGSTATCTNSERASATIAVTEHGSTQRWALDGTAHAEVGTRP